MTQQNLSNRKSQTLTKKPTNMAQQIEDSVLVRDYISGDEKSLEVLINRHNQRITSFIYSKVLDRDITEDIFQDTFIKVIKTLKKGTYSEEGKFLPWVMRIAHNLIIDHFRKNKRMPKFEGNDDFNIFSVIGDDKLNAEKQIIKNQIDSDLKHLIEELPDDQKEVLLMRIYKDMSFKEISENTGVSINTALGRMRYALINLRKIIEKHKIVLTN
jgi:RNA polymerase sigma-70 factor (ECF subfamily)